MRLCVIAMLVATHAFAQSSPGPVAKSHEAFEQQCNACHVNGTAALSNAQCSGCHASMLSKGLHATSLVTGKLCFSCHGEHRGRAFDLQGWSSIPGGKARFDHELAGWKLRGAHVVGCDRCHTAKTAGGLTRFVGLSTECASCHQQRNPHGASARPEMAKCERCHTETVWKPAKAAMDFEHDRDTAMPLVGAHRDVSCARCHPKSAFASARTECTSCHKTGPHKSALFDVKPCEWCHAPTYKTFSATGFDHDKTPFKLDAGHRVACVRCHTTKLGAVPPSTRCEDCHAGKSNHGKRFQKIQGGCVACHTATKWTSVSSATFSHGSHTPFVLTQRHADIKCRACHRGSTPDAFENLSKQSKCKGCHEHARVHADFDHPQGKYTTDQCLSCHLLSHPPPRPVSISIFHGPKSTFPLVKGHKAVPCADCHVKQSPKGKMQFEGVSVECGDECHEDSHKAALGKKCSSCHVSGTWDAVKFEHSSYPLEGAHTALTCATCHGLDKKFKGTPRRCADVACHARDDAHRGMLGGTCDRCHLANGDNRFTHALMSKWKLDGKHLEVACADCHPTRAFKPRPRTCSGCHPEPRAHFGDYGTWCERCHTTTSWDAH